MIKEAVDSSVRISQLKDYCLETRKNKPEGPKTDFDFKPVRASSIQEGIYEELANAIVSGKIRPGERITLESIASQFDVSIMPVREAFRKLEATKLVTREKNRSIRISELSVENIREMLDIRLMLEPYAAEKAVMIRTEKAVQILSSLHNQMENTEDVDTYLKTNREFHFTIYEEAKLPILVEIIESLWERYSPYLYILHRTEKDWPIEMVMKNHQGILKAVQKKDKDKIRYWLGKDLTDSAERIIDMIENRGFE